jgi:hypothetical protein
MTVGESVQFDSSQVRSRLVDSNCSEKLGRSALVPIINLTLIT